jgi:glycosyltransferase involved in cell wall biosynthesis
MEKLRILFVTHTARWSGPNKSLMLLIEGLSDDFEVGVASAGEGPFSFELRNRGIRYWALDSLGTRAVIHLMRIVYNEDYKLIYSNTSMGHARTAWLASLMTRRPFHCHIREMGRGKSWSDLGFLMFAKAVIAVSNSCGDSIRHFVRSQRLHVVHNGVPELRVRHEPADCRKKLLQLTGASSDDALIVLSGHIVKHKNQLDLVEAIQKLVQEGISIHVALLGSTDKDPQYYQAVQDLIAKYNLAEQISFLGFRDDIIELLIGADICVHPTLSDAHPRAVLEAMQVGLPVIAYATDGVIETVADNVTGKLVPQGNVQSLGQALRELIGNTELREKMSRESTKRVSEFFSADRTSQLIEKILRSSVPH